MPLVEVGPVFAGWKAAFNYDSGNFTIIGLVLVSQRQTYTFTRASNRIEHRVKSRRS